MAKKYKIERNLVLNDIKEGGPEDNVLVIDANNEVGYVPRSEFGGGGGSQDLQSVLDNGNYSEVDDGGSNLSVMTGLPNNRYFLLNLSNGLEKVSTLSVNNDLSYFLTGVNQDYGEIKSESGLIYLKQRRGDNLTTIGIQNGPANIEINFPAKNASGTYTLATLDDIPAGLTTTITIVGFGTFTFTNGVLTDFLYFPIVEP
jgi:hypothetical protein